MTCHCIIRTEQKPSSQKNPKIFNAKEALKMFRRILAFERLAFEEATPVEYSAKLAEAELVISKLQEENLRQQREVSPIIMSHQTPMSHL